MLKHKKDFGRYPFIALFSLTSCVGKLLERLVICHLQWFLEDTNLLLLELSRFCRVRGTVDCIADPASPLEDSRHRRETA